MAANARSFNALRKQLNEMGYNFHLSYQSVNLVKHLLDDLLQTAKCLQEMKQRFQDDVSIKADSGVQAAFESLQEENCNLRKENEELQLGLIKQAERTDQNCDDNLKKIMILQKENAELKILNSQHLHKIHTLEKEKQEISKCLLELQQKYPAIIQTVIPDFNNKCTKRKVSTFRHQKMEIGSGNIHPSSDVENIQSAVTQVEDEYLSNMLELADKRIVQLEDELNKLKSNSEQHFQHSQQNQFTLTQLEEEKKKLEDDLEKSEANQKETENQFRKLTEKNKNLEREICELKLFNEKLKKENDKILSVSTKELDNISGYLTKSHCEVEYLENNIGIVNKVAAYVSTRKFKELEKDRDYYKSQYETIRARELKSLSTPPTRDSMAVLESKNKKIIKEREDLRKTVFKYETQINQLQKAIKELSDEKDKFRRMYREIEGENKIFERRVGLSLADRSATRSLERENEKLQKDLHQICHERDTLQKRLQIATETQLSERCRLEKTIKYQSGRLHSLEEERNSLCSQLQSHQNVMSEMENQILCLEQEIAQLKDINGKQNGNADRVKQLMEQMRQQLVEAEEQSLHSRQELQVAEENIRALEEKLKCFDLKKMKFKGKVEEFQQTMYSLDQEKDKLQSEVDAKTEYICQLQEALNQKDREIQDLTITVSNLESNLDRLQDDVRQKDKEIQELRKQCECLINDLEHSTQSKNGIMQQVESLQQDLETMIRENQRLHCEMDLQMKEQSQLKEKIQNYINEVARVEFLLNEKDQERYQLLEQFHTVSEEANCLEAQNTHLESQTESARFELETKEVEVKQLNSSISTMQQQIEQLCDGKQTLEKDNQELQQNAARLEAKCSELLMSKNQLEEEYDGLRELCSQLQNSRDKSCAELSEKEQEVETLQHQVNEMQSRLDSLENDVHSERTRTLELENVIACTRQKECETQIRIQELTEELKMSEKQLFEAEQKLLKSNEEVSCLRAKAAHADATVEKLHREITNIKFEKEMLSQKLRECQRTLKQKNTPCYSDSMSRNDDIISSQFHYDSFLDTEGTRNYSANTRLHSDFHTPPYGDLPSKTRRSRLPSGGKESKSSVEETPDELLIKSHRDKELAENRRTLTLETSALDSLPMSNLTEVQNTSLSRYHQHPSSKYSVSNKESTKKSFPDLSKSSLDLYKRLTSKHHLSDTSSMSRSYIFHEDHGSAKKDIVSTSALSYNLPYSAEGSSPPRTTTMDFNTSWKHSEPSSSHANKSFLSRTFDLNSSESSTKYSVSK